MLVAMATLTFYFGVTEPLMVFEQFFFFEKEASLIDIVRQLWIDQSWPLAIVLGLFSIAFPVLKLAYLAAVSLSPARFSKGGWLSLFSTLSKWSMLDVLVVAVVIVATKTTGLAKVTTLPGLWFFTASVFFMAVATLWAARLRASPQ